MQLHWLAVIECLSVLATSAVPTHDTLVVSRSSDVPKAEPVTTHEMTIDEPLAPIKLTEMEVISDVSQRYANTMVVVLLRNPAKRAQEANFRVLLPETAYITGFVMVLNGKPYKAYVKEKDEAKQIYDQAVNQGFGAAHVTAKARDSNQFVVSVNVEPLSIVIFKLTYEELLIRRNNVYNHVINLHPGELVAKLSVTVHIKEVQKITELRIPEIRTGNEVDATKDDAQNSKAVVTKGFDDGEAIITFIPSLEEQKRLMEIFAIKSKESVSDTSIWNQMEDSDTSDEQGVLGQFVVQYDVERSEDGEILVNNDFFVHFFAPKSLPPLNKYVVFVLDTSESMFGHKINQLREAMQTIFSDLNSGDYFSIVEFASVVTIHELKEADQKFPKAKSYQFYWSNVERKPKLVPPSLATPENIAKAKVIISRFNANGGTNIDSALDVAVNLIRNRTEWSKKPKPNIEIAVGAGAGDKNAEVYNIERMKDLEPIIIFLTDGDPTVGETDTMAIIDRITKHNQGENKATIHSLAFGEDADPEFLRKLSLRNDGFTRHIYEAADAHRQLQDFYRQVSKPLLADIKLDYPANQVKEGTLTKNKYRRFYAGSEIVVAGRIEDGVNELTPHVFGFSGVENGFRKKRYEKHSKASVPDKSPIQHLERLWAYLTIKQLLDERDANEGDPESPKENRPETRALALALKYEFVTPLTSLVVVKPNSTTTVDAEFDDEPTSSSTSTSTPISTSTSSLVRLGSPTYLPPPNPGYSSSARMPVTPAGPMKSHSEFTERHLLSLPGGTTEPSRPTTGPIRPKPPLSVSPIARYGLEKYSWVEPLLNISADVLVLDVNGVNINLKLLKDSEVLSENDPACDNAIDSGAGICVYLSYCDSAKHINVDTYKTTYCSVDEGYAGVCCKTYKVDKPLLVAQTAKR